MGTEQPPYDSSSPASPPVPLDYLNISVSPSFEPDESFRISQTPDKDAGKFRYRLSYEVCFGDDRWDRASGQVGLSDRQVRAICDLCRDIKVVPKDSPDIGLDGTTTEITFCLGGNKLKLEYWEKPPAEWGPIDKLIRRVRAIVKRAIPKRGGSLPGRERFLKN